MSERMRVDLSELAVDVAPNPRTIGVMLELDGASTLARVPASPLNRPVTAGYVMRTVAGHLPGLHDEAHRVGATVNDALLWAWSHALHRRLEAVGMAGVPVVLSFTVTSPSLQTQSRLGAIRVRIPPPGASVVSDLRELAHDTRWRKRWTTGPSWWLTAQVFRLLGALGRNRRLIDGQRSTISLLTQPAGTGGAPSVLGGRDGGLLPRCPRSGCGA